MKINEKLYVKYGVNAVILPPPPEDEDITKETNPEHAAAWRSSVSPFLSEFALEEGEDGLDPDTFEGFEPSITKERGPRFHANEAVLDDFESVKKDLGEETKLTPTQSTIPPGKRAQTTPDTLLKMCSKYYDLCNKF